MRGCRKCELCECEGTEENPVTSGPDPAAYELYGDDTSQELCEECRQKLAEDI